LYRTALGFLSEDEDDLDGDLDGGEKGGNAGERAANAVRAMESDAMRVELSRQDADSRSRLLVSEMMILAGDLAGALGAEEGVPLPYRRQAPPRDDARDRDVVDALPPGLPREFAIRATMRGATQSSSPGPHASLGVDAYVQFTSPIRRHTDLLAQYQLKAHLRGERKLPLDKARIPHTGPHTTPFARCTPILEDFLSRRVSPPITPRFQSRHTATPFNSTPDAFRLHPDVRSYGPSTLSSRWTRC
jgi:exoribonuclease-2